LAFAEVVETKMFAQVCDWIGERVHVRA
jgi:hypothetical protein